MSFWAKSQELAQERENAVDANEADFFDGTRGSLDEQLRPPAKAERSGDMAKMTYPYKPALYQLICLDKMSSAPTDVMVPTASPYQLLYRMVFGKTYTPHAQQKNTAP